MKMKNPELNAWCDYPLIDPPKKKKSGALAGLSLAVKDIYPVAGYPNGWGSPTRLALAKPDKSTQICVQKLLDAGAEMAGKSQCDELCFSLNGVNAHYGAPVNGAAPDRITGGSSSGSASLVSNAIVDMATGSDTGGSVRAPASYCGLIGLRPTHGRLSLEGAMALAPSFDCFGWFAKDAETYAEIGKVLLGRDGEKTELNRLIACPELDSQLLGGEEYRAFSRAAERVEKHFGRERLFENAPFDVSEAYWAFRVCQAHEAHLSLGDWIKEHQPDLGAPIRERFEFGAKLTAAEIEHAKGRRMEVSASLENMIGEDGLLVFPTSPSCAPLKSENMETLQAFREQALKLLCLSGLSGLPQITLPLCRVYDAPMGLSLMGPKGADARLIEIAKNILEG